MDLKKLERFVKAHVEAGNTDKAVKAVYDTVIYFAKKKDFAKAEFLRDKIYEIDPLALTEIVESAEFIEREKNQSIDKNHQKIFQNLYSELTPEEGNALFFAMEEKNFKGDEIFFKQGEKNSSIYFLNRGGLKVIHKKGKEDIFIKDLQPGDIAGVESFFKTTVCTNSLCADMQGNIHVLRKNELEALKENFPGLEPKLKDYIYSRELTSDYIKGKGVNRRVYKRFESNGAIVFQILSASGKAIGKVLRGKLADVSVGGLSFYFTTSNERNVKLLLGRDLMMKFIIPESRNRCEIKKRGQVLSVLPQTNHEYSIHLKFGSLLEAKYLA